MDIDIRPIAPHEYEALLYLDGRTFGITYENDYVEAARGLLDLDRQIVAVDGPELVGAAGAWTFDITVPGGTSLPTAGVTWVSVSGTHRRRGILRRMMAHQLDDLAERGDPLAILTASESVIYGRFGYGLATFRTKLVVEGRRVQLRAGLGADGLVRFADPSTARKVEPVLYDRLRAMQPGTVTRSDAWWDFIFVDPPSIRDGATALFHAVHPDGFVSYRVRDTLVGGSFTNGVQVRELVSLTPEAHASLWRFLLGLDLVHEVEWYRAPRHETLRWLVDDPRRVRTEAVDDDMWLRLIDVERAFAGRRYPVPDRLVIEVVDAFRPATSGRYEIDGSPDGAECRRTTSEPDLALDIADLGSLYLGGVDASTLARAGRIEERTVGAIQRADRFFASDPPPHNQTAF
ncbi:MAG TPA: GNAT family N-acetyltransferase [Acidimicrobiales bacterium]|nr:GNAT family N-acetyltransferase [Acidimicrobiales bacterium]